MGKKRKHWPVKVTPAMPPPKKKPIDRWLGGFGIAVSAVLYLIKKTPFWTVALLIVIFSCLMHPVWNFWWVEKSPFRQVTAVLALAVGCTFIGYKGWPSSVFKRPSDPKYQPPKNKLIGIEGNTPPSSSQMCLGLSDEERTSCLCPNLVPYTIEALPPPDTDNYATLLTLNPSEPIYNVRIFLRGTFSKSFVLYPTDEMAKRLHFSSAQGLMQYDLSRGYSKALLRKAKFNSEF